MQEELPNHTSEELTLPRLESHLWEAANILRGSPVDRTDWKSYILPLLFFKRICDVWDEEHAEMVETYGQDFADEHRFQVPEEHHWTAIRETPSNVGTALANALRGIERANQQHLYGVFGDAQWTNKDRLPDDLLKDLLEHFSALSLGNQSARRDVMGDAYEYLIKQFADTTTKKAGEFYTPRSVVRLMVDILAPRESETIYDPACGTGGMLLAAVEYVRDAGGDPRTFFGKLYGQEKNLTTSSVARMNLLLHGVEDFHIERGDTLRSPVFTDSSTGALATFDIVLANPPFSLKNWGRDVWENDPWGRAFAGVPADKSGDFAWVQHMIQSMAPGHGRMAVIMPQGALYRAGVERNIRRTLLEMRLVEAVIGLPGKVFYGTSHAAGIVILRREDSDRDGVLFIDASRCFRRGKAQNHIDPRHAAEIFTWYRSAEPREGTVAFASLPEIAEHNWSLDVGQYVLPPVSLTIPTLHDARQALQQAADRARHSERLLLDALAHGGRE